MRSSVSFRPSPSHGTIHETFARLPRIVAELPFPEDALMPRALPLLFVGLTALAAQTPTAPPADHIKQLIQQLGNARFTEREAATRALHALGEPALKSLREAAATNPDAEIRRRAD